MSGNWEVGLWARPEAKPGHSDLDERRRGGVFDVLMQQADEARSRVREGTERQGMPLLELCLRGRVLLPSRPGGLLEVKLLLLANLPPASATERGGVPLLARIYLV